MTVYLSKLDYKSLEFGVNYLQYFLCKRLTEMEHCDTEHIAIELSGVCYNGGLMKFGK